MLNGSYHFLSNILINRGQFYVCSKPSDISTFDPHEFDNGNIINLGNVWNYGTYVIDDGLSINGPDVVFDGNTLHNEGQLYVGAGNGITTPAYPNIPANEITNSGLLYFEQTSGDEKGRVSLGKSRATTFINGGSICIVNNVFTQTSPVIGSGYIFRYESNILLNDTTTDQTFYLTSKSTIEIKSKIATPPVFIGIQKDTLVGAPFPVLESTYNPDTGILQGISFGEVQEIGIRKI